MNEMIERGAMALYEWDLATRVEGPPNDLVSSWQLLTDARRRHYLGASRRHIAAMREPTEAMLDAADRESNGDLNFVVSVYKTMVDAALAEERKS